jgi:hypothetical protein
MNSIIKMFGPALSGPARLVNRDVPACDELAYKAAGYKRGSIPEVADLVDTPAVSEAAANPEQKPKLRKKKTEAV